MTENEIQIVEASWADAAVIANYVRAAFRDVADLMKVTPETCPAFPAFCQTDWIEKDMDKGIVFFFAQAKGRRVGCVGMSKPAGEECEMRRLAVMPEYRHHGIGRKLVEFILARAKQQGLQHVTLHLAAGHVRLRKWYEGIGFVMSGKKRFDHIPFDVGYMKYELFGMKKNETERNDKDYEVCAKEMTT